MGNGVVLDKFEGKQQLADRKDHHVSNEAWQAIGDTGTKPGGKDKEPTNGFLEFDNPFPQDSGSSGPKKSDGAPGADPRPFKPDDFKDSGIDQTGLGDCWYMASAAAMAQSPEGRHKLSDMIKRNDDGSYTVTFPGDKDNPVTVKRDEVNGNDKIKDDAAWARVLEAAILKRDPERAKNGGPPQDAIDLLSGDYVQHDRIFSGAMDSDKGRIVDSIKQSLAEGKPVVASVGEHNGIDGVLVDNHAYTVTDYDPKTDTITVRNPWGHNDLGCGNTKDGVTDIGDGKLTMSMDTFMKHYTDIAYPSQPKSTVQQVGQTISDATHEIVNFFF